MARIDRRADVVVNCPTCLNSMDIYLLTDDHNLNGDPQQCRSCLSPIEHQTSTEYEPGLSVLVISAEYRVSNAKQE